MICYILPERSLPQKISLKLPFLRTSLFSSAEKERHIRLVHGFSFRRLVPAQSSVCSRAFFDAQADSFAVAATTGYLRHELAGLDLKAVVCSRC